MTFRSKNVSEKIFPFSLLSKECDYNVREQTKTVARRHLVFIYDDWPPLWDGLSLGDSYELGY